MGIMGLTEIMDRSLEILKKYIKTIVIFNLAYGAISFCMILGFVIVGSILTAIIIGLKLSVVIIPIAFSIFGIGIFAFIISFKIGLIKISSQEFLQEKIYASQAIGDSFRKTLRVLGVLVMETLLFIPVIAIFAGIGYWTYISFKQSMIFSGMYDKSELGLIIISIVIALLAIFSFFSYITIFCFSFQVLAIEDKGVFASLKRSFNLVKGDFFKILGCSILFSLSIYAITSSLQSFIGIVASLIYMILKFLNVTQDFLAYMTLVYTYAQWPINILSWLVISPVGTIMITHLYYNQRFKKDGFDIVLELNKIQKDNEKEQLSECTQYNHSI
ncbi:hypothetical protein K2F43_18685 [Clostridium estertheticum]|uniref:hypothetical protein n=1 Tax=Clostridium estertheticum TaxID=238834 RepID=UPI001C6E0A0E|nr:hypothetical protein [Clostridium estertheticum]MBW9173226.1 hypothetical protein [Clostridium estertheticum]WLC73821.1 hypothetical protein KTC99_13630 [Clostridium estertheticum]